MQHFFELTALSESDKKKLYPTPKRGKREKGKKEKECYCYRCTNRFIDNICVLYIYIIIANNDRSIWFLVRETLRHLDAEPKDKRGRKEGRKEGTNSFRFRALDRDVKVRNRTINSADKVGPVLKTMLCKRYLGVVSGLAT